MNTKNTGIEQGIERERGLIIYNALQNGHTPEQISKLKRIFKSFNMELLI